MAFDAQIERISQIKADIIASQQQRLLSVAFDLSALVKLRIQTKGQNAKGGQFAPYVPSYARERKAAGYQIGFVDYTRTGQFWASVGPRLVSSAQNITTVVIESRNARGQEILRDAKPKRGNLLAASQKEIDFAQEKYTRDLAAKIRL